MKLTKTRFILTRKYVENNPDTMFIFTDNGNRSSGKNKIPDDSEYSLRFGKKNLKYPTTTSAIIRGLPNAYPITTQKEYFPYYKSYMGNWNDSDFDEFKKVIDDDFEHIKKACVEKGYKEIVFPMNGVLNRKISRLTIDRTPKLFRYIVDKEIELKEFEPGNYIELCPKLNQ